MLPSMRKIIGSLMFGLLATALPQPVSALEAGDTVRIIVGFSPGGGYDAEARMAAPYIEKSLRKRGFPKVNVIVENVTGGAGAIGTSTVYAAKPDGTTLGFFAPATSLWQEKLMNAKFVVRKFGFIAQQSLESYALAVRADIGIDDFASLVKRSHDQPILMGTSGQGAYSDHIFPELLSLVLAKNGTDLKFEYLHLGGTGDVMASMRRGEAEGFLAGLTAFEKFVEEGHAKFLFTFADTKWPNAKAVLNLPEDQYAMIASAAASQRVYIAPPGVDSKLLATLRDAVKEALTSEEFLEKANQANRPVSFVDGEGVKVLIGQAADLAQQYGDEIKQRLNAK